MTNPPLVGIFVGGAGQRMGGVAKGSLREPGGQTIVERLSRVVREAMGNADLTLVGNAAAYRALGLPSLADEPAGIGPLGGLRALLAEAARRDAPFAVALACDLPFVSSKLLGELASASPGADCVAPRQDGRWQPLCARYAPRPALVAADAALARGEHSLQRVLARMNVSELPLTPDAIAELRDWDEPGDVQ